MPYYRRPYKRARYGKRIKYSIQQKAFQFVATAGPIRIGSPIGRNLNDGDSIVLIVRPNSTADASIQGTCRYAISLQ